MVGLYRLLRSGTIPCGAIDTPLHGFLRRLSIGPFDPDGEKSRWLARANGPRREEREFNADSGMTCIWLPWQRPGL